MPPCDVIVIFKCDFFLFSNQKGSEGGGAYQQVVGPDLPGAVQRCLAELQDVLVAEVVPVLRSRLIREGSDEEE